MENHLTEVEQLREQVASLQRDIAHNKAIFNEQIRTIADATKHKFYDVFSVDIDDLLDIAEEAMDYAALEPTGSDGARRFASISRKISRTANHTKQEVDKCKLALQIQQPYKDASVAELKALIEQQLTEINAHNSNN